MEQCADPDAPKEKCVLCGETIYTCERENSVNNSYLCPIKSHNNGVESAGGLWICENCQEILSEAL